MEGLDTLIVDLAYILIVAGITTLIFKKINQPVVLGYIVAGFLTGPNFGLLPNILGETDISVWADMGIIFIMFALGLEFSFQKIANVGGGAIITAVTVIAAMLFVGYAVGEMLGWSDMDSIFLGGMISMSSTSIILKAYEELGLKKEKFAELVLGALVLEDIAGIFMMIILSTISASKDVDGLAMLRNIGILLVYLVLWLVLGIYLIPTFLKKTNSLANDETLLVVSLGLCLGMVVLANAIGFSSALGAFVAGSILAGTVKAERIERLVSPIKDLFGAVFFISVGMLVDPELLIKYWFPILIITLIVIIGQNFFSTIGVLLAGQSLHTAVRAGFSMVQIGEFSFIIATLGTSLGVTSDFLYPIIVCVSVITTFTTPIFIRSGEKAYELRKKLLPKKLIDFLNRYTSENQSKHESDRDWKEYMGRYSMNTIICGAMIFAIYTFSRLYLPDILRALFPSNTGRSIELAVTIAAMLPFISMLCATRRSMLYKKLWVKHPANRLPLTALHLFRIFISCISIGIVLRSYLRIPVIVLLFFSLLLVFVVGRSEFLSGVSLRLQARFFANYNERALEKLREERKENGKIWASEELYVVKFMVKKTLPGTFSIRNFNAKREYGIDIIKIKRGDVHIVLPGASDEVLPGDILHVMGLKEELDAYAVMLEKAKYVDEMDGKQIRLSSYIEQQSDEGIEPEDQVMLCAVEVTRNGRFDRKQIRNCGFREKFGGYIIGIERGDISLLSPESSFFIEAGDIMWVMGNKNMAELLYASGYLG